MNHREPDPEARPAIPDDNAPLPPARWPTRWTVRRGRAIAAVLLGLALAASLLSVYLTYGLAQESNRRAADVEARLDVLEEDLADRTRQRDEERDAAAARDAEFGAYLCRVLGQLPADSPGADRLRDTLHCAEPGVAGIAARQPSGAAEGAQQPTVAGRASPNPRVPVTAELTPSAARPPAAPAGPTTAPASPANPVEDPRPITDPLCSALGVCLP